MTPRTAKPLHRRVLSGGKNARASGSGRADAVRGDIRRDVNSGGAWPRRKCDVDANTARA
eukprot:CAMPEP_0183305416 /NCGR_PEP_ID=MMETSP0160_2-20130417/10164_1 /TAXON_ID=2839 ORGANISM="Odontella Sinensis, Strain Grunow 1884" /NCGR_SAMPLE_ID=MMETSP0160_2 /ASSEMBLY_ACC=CAM_ASM_000250 /LENGTH=59 /DNA_ID=CAMNT_0025468605 /DNA_START=1 /DNA_END=180 /DNA_ORIENTATION=-